MKITKRQLRKLIREASENESWWEGFDSAAYKGNGGNENPYPSDSELARAWDQGYEKARGTGAFDDDDDDVSDPQLYNDRY